MFELTEKDKINLEKIKNRPHKYKFSYSKISNYLNCPKQYELKDIRRLSPYRENIYTAFGSAIHSSIEETMGKHFDIEESTCIFRREFKKRFELIDPLESQFIIESEWYAKGKECLEYYFKEYHPKILNKTIEIIDIEKKFEFELFPNIFINGKVDLVYKENIIKKTKIIKEVPKQLKNGTIKLKKVKEELIDNIVLNKILDWKTGRKQPKKDNYQLRLYASILTLLMRTLFCEINYIFIKHQSENTSEVTLDMIQDTIDYTKRILLDIINDTINYEENNIGFERKCDEFKCRFCEVKKICNEELKKESIINFESSIL